MDKWEMGIALCSRSLSQFIFPILSTQFTIVGSKYSRLEQIIYLASIPTLGHNKGRESDNTDFCGTI